MKGHVRRFLTVAHSIRWTNEEARLKRLISRGRTQAQTAEILERTVVAIAQRASKLKYDPLFVDGGSPICMQHLPGQRSQLAHLRPNPGSHSMNCRWRFLRPTVMPRLPPPRPHQRFFHRRVSGGPAVRLAHPSCSHCEHRVFLCFSMRTFARIQDSNSLSPATVPNLKI